MIARLAPCASCARHVREDERVCPFCAAAFVARPSGPSAARLARGPALALAGTLAGTIAIVACQGNTDAERARPDRARVSSGASVSGGSTGSTNAPVDAAPLDTRANVPAYGVPPPLPTSLPAPPPSASTSAGAGAAGAAAVVHTATPRFKRCYERELTIDPAAHGKTTLSIEVSAAGSVTSVKASPGELSPALLACLESTARRLMFPATVGTTSLAVPLVFAGE